MIEKKLKISTITLIFTLIITIPLLLCSSTVYAQSIQTKKSYAVVMVRPSTIGVGQTLLIITGISESLPNAEYGWEGLRIKVTKPDGTTEVLGPFKSESTGTTYATYNPMQQGTYYVQTTFDGMWLNTTDFNRYYEPSISDEIPVTVTQDQIADWPEFPLPDEYWSHPINSENRQWTSIGGNWLMAYYDGRNNPFNPYTTAPNSAHIMWTKELEFGGIVGGDYDFTSYYSGESYENKWDPPVIMNGRLYYNKRLGSSSWLGFACVDLRTGKELWFKNGTTISYGQLLNFDSPNQHGVIPYLISASGSTISMFDALTGEWILDLENVPGGSTLFGPNGEILKYRLFTQDDILKLSLWNSTQVDGLISYNYGEESPLYRPPLGGTLDASTGIMWTKNLASISGNPRISIAFDDVLIVTAYDPEQLERGLFIQETGWNHYGIDIRPGHEGEMMWSKSNPISGNRTVIISAARGVAQGEGVYTAWVKETRQYFGYDAYTGNKLWETDSYEDYWGMYQMGAGAIAYGTFFTAAFDGRVHAYDIETGTEVWSYYSGDSGLETPYGQFPYCAGITGAGSVLSVADGKVYAINNEHSPTQPLYRGYRLHVINATDGTSVWSITGWYQHPAIADGFVTTLNAADNQLYTFGKGPSAITVTAPDTDISLGASVTLKGTIMDVSAGTKQDTIAARFPQGVPVVSDASMSNYMEYVYMQFPQPTDAVGVSIRIQVVDPDGEYAWIGTATSDPYGNYAYSFIPQKEGLYSIIATFDGTESYWGSETTTYLGVGPAMTPSGPITPEPQPETPLISSEVALVLIAAIAAIVIIAFLLLRRK